VLVDKTGIGFTIQRWEMRMEKKIPADIFDPELP
jgi:hypothetical protein